MTTEQEFYEIFDFQLLQIITAGDEVISEVEFAAGSKIKSAAFRQLSNCVNIDELIKLVDVSSIDAKTAVNGLTYRFTRKETP